MPLRLLTLGPPTVRDGDLPVAGAAAQPRRLALLAMLARAGDRGITRDKLVAVLWPDEEEERAKRNLTHALYSLRRDLGNEEAILGTKDLRLNPDLLVADVEAFTQARRSGDLRRAAELYVGPFLDGFHLPASGEFERWAERERGILAEEYRGTLEALATTAELEGDRPEAVAWWRRAASHDPIDARIALRLMQALVRAGDVGGALKHARIYEALVQQELELTPDRTVVAYADALRREPSAPPPATGPAPSGVTGPSLPEPIPAPMPLRRSRWPWAVAAALALIALTFALRHRDDSAVPVLAVGALTDHRPDSSDQETAAIRDLLATNLARGPALRVLSTARLYELIPAGAAVTPGELTRAAREAGATELIDGALFALPDGRLRLDLRRVLLADGAVRETFTVVGRDPFALVDSGTSRLLATLGRERPSSSVASVTTTSLAAYKLYEQGLRAYSVQDHASAERLFAAALAEDSTFALAAYYLASSTTGEVSLAFRRFDHARELARNAPERERLIIEAGWASTMTDPSLGPVADSLRARYPDELLGQLYAGQARISEGDFARSLEPFDIAIRGDSARAVTGGVGRCITCEAVGGRVTAYDLMDSFPAALREADRYVRLLPQDPIGHLIRSGSLERLGRIAEAFAEVDRAAALDPESSIAPMIRARFLIYAGRPEEGERILEAYRPSAAERDRADVHWNLALAQREEGRYPEALRSARRYRAILADRTGSAGAPPSSQLEAELLRESGHPREAAVLFDSAAHWAPPDISPSSRARTLTWGMVHAADALAAAGDTTHLAALADSIERISAGSGFGRDRRMHHHVRGLLQLARGDSAGAEREFRAAVYSWTDGYTRTSQHLAELLLAEGRDAEARPILEAALRGAIDGSNLYVSRRELRVLLAQARASRP